MVTWWCVLVAILPSNRTLIARALPAILRNDVDWFAAFHAHAVLNAATAMWLTLMVWRQSPRPWHCLCETIQRECQFPSRTCRWKIDADDDDGTNGASTLSAAGNSSYPFHYYSAIHLDSVSPSLAHTRARTLFSFGICVSPPLVSFSFSFFFRKYLRQLHNYILQKVNGIWHSLEHIEHGTLLASNLIRI